MCIISAIDTKTRDAHKFLFNYLFLYFSFLSFLRNKYLKRLSVLVQSVFFVLLSIVNITLYRTEASDINFCWSTLHFSSFATSFLLSFLSFFRSFFHLLVNWLVHPLVHSLDSGIFILFSLVV